MLSNSEEKKSKAEKLKEELFLNNKKSGALKVKDDDLKKANEFSVDYKKFLNVCKTEREVVNYTVDLAKKHSFTEFNPGKKYKSGDKVYYVNRNKSLILCIIGKHGVKKGTKLSIAHIDSPRIDLKPNPLYEANNLAFFKTHYYGGIKKYQWLAMPLALHGIIIKKDGKSVNITLGEKEGEIQFCITDLLPHLAKDQMSKTVSKAIEGENLNVLIGSLPFKDEKASELVKLNIISLLNKKYGIAERDFACADLSLVPAFKAVDIGFDASMIGGYGHDDRVCAYPTIKATLNFKGIPDETVISVLTDREETGSDGNTGMKCDYLKYFIMDLAKNDGVKYQHVLTKSKCLSSDVDAAFDPTYSSVYDANNSSHINGGVVITKYTGSGGKSGTSEASAEYMNYVRTFLEKDKILWQTGELGKVDSGGGGTIAKYIANLNVDVVDLGIPVLSMHAPFEVISKLDLYETYRAILAFFNA